MFALSGSLANRNKQCASPNKMCDTMATRFFRPWNATESEDKASPVERLDIPEESSPGVRLIKQEEDNESVLSISICEESSATSFSENDTSPGPATAGPSSLIPRRRRRRSSASSVYGSTSSRSCSVNSGDTTEGSSLDMLSNFVFNSHAAPDYPVAPVVTESTEVLAADAVTGKRTEYGVHGLVYHQPDYLRDMAAQRPNGFAALANNGGPTCLVPSVEPVGLQPPIGQSFYYGVPDVQLAQRLYPASVQEAVELIHRQDAAAKQMKKLRPKKFRCEHCDVAFSNNGQLKGHVRIHTGERPFKCDAEGCGKSFTRNEELTRHKRIHTGLRPHACVLCGKCFGRKDHLKKHTRTHDAKDPYRMSAAALGIYALGHSLPPVHGPLPPYVYPI